MTEQEWLASEDPRAMLGWLRLAAMDADFKHPGGELVSGRKLALFALACAHDLGPDSPWPGWFDRLERKNFRPVKDHFTPEEAARYWCGVKLGQHHPVDLRRDDRAKITAACLREIVGNPWQANHVYLPYHKRAALLTPQVLSLAQQAYEERGRPCEACGGAGCQATYDIGGSIDGNEPCEACNGTGRTEDGVLDPLTLLALADALEESGLPEELENVEVVGGHSCPKCGGKAPYRSGGPHFENERLCPKCWISWSPGGTTWINRPVPDPFLQHLRSPGPHFRGCFVVDLILGKS